MCEEVPCCTICLDGGDEPLPVQREAGHRAQHGGEPGGDHGDDQRVDRGREHLLVGEQLGVPARGEAHPLRVELAVVEAEDHQQTALRRKFASMPKELNFLSI